MATIYHGNPYTHEEHRRTSYANTDGRQQCDWCGQTPRVLFEYDNDKQHLFCNKDCFKSYHF